MRSVRTRGVGGTSRAMVRMAISLFSNPHLLQHLLVPWEMLANPRHAASWVQDRFSFAGPVAQGLPWIAFPCVDFLTGYLEPTHNVFEWGGGGSTIFFLKKGCRVTTVESSAEWVQQLEAQVGELGGDARSRWDLRYVPLSDNSDPAVADYVQQVTVGGAWDLILVDGWRRLKCLHEGLHHVKPGGALVLDNANQKQFVSVPQMMQTWERHELRGLGVARSWVTRTDVYVRPEDEGDRVNAGPAEGAMSA